MKLKQALFIVCLTTLFASNTNAGILSFLLKHDNTITAGIAGIIAANIFPPQFIRNKFLIPNPANNQYMVPLTGVIRILTALERPEFHKIAKHITHVYTPAGKLVVGATSIAAGIAAYKLVKNYLTARPANQNNNQ